MKVNKRIVGVAALLGAIIATAAVRSDGGYIKSTNKGLSQSTRGESSENFESAGYSFAVTDLARNGSDVTFTIPENAHEQEKKADAVVVSGLYDRPKKNSDECPLVQSTAISKSVIDYKPISGKAQVKAHFDDEAIAKAAIEQGCLLINDPK